MSKSQRIQQEPLDESAIQLMSKEGQEAGVLWNQKQKLSRIT